MPDQPFMNFEIRQKVHHFKDGQSFNELSSLELQPIFKVSDLKKQIDVTGHLVLNGEFLKKEYDWENQFDLADGIHYGSFFKKQDDSDTFQHQIPVSFEIERERVQDLSEVFVIVEHFDYEILSNDEMELIAHVKLLGVRPELKQDHPVEANNQDDYQEYSFRENVDISTESQKKTNAEDEKLKSKEKKAAEDTEDLVEKVEAKPEGESTDAGVEQHIEAAVEPVSEAVPKMKIGIKGKNRDSSDKQENKSSNPLYSLLKKDQKKDQDTTKATEVNKTTERDEQPEAFENVKTEQSSQQVKEEVEQEKDNVKEAVENLESDNQINDNIISLPVAENEKEVIVLTELEQSAEDEVDEKGLMDKKEEPVEPSRKKSTKDMLFSLVQGNEDKKYKLKIYLVQKEDTLQQIADKYGLKSEVIVKHNQLNSHDLAEGQLLYLPALR